MQQTLMQRLMACVPCGEFGRVRLEAASEPKGVH
jgi:hypothetical protein